LRGKIPAGMPIFASNAIIQCPLPKHPIPG
jgi:hypothetical protein